MVKHDATAKKEEAARTALAAAETAAAARRETARALADVAGRAQELARKLPKEKELADAARVFVNRSAAAATELAALEKVSGENGVALKIIGEERAAVDHTVETARARVRQVRESVRREEAVAAPRPVASCPTPGRPWRTTSVAWPHSRRTPDGTGFADRSTRIVARWKPCNRPSPRPRSTPRSRRRSYGRGRMRRGLPRRPGGSRTGAERTPRPHSNASGRPRPALMRPSRRPGPRSPAPARRRRPGRGGREAQGEDGPIAVRPRRTGYQGRSRQIVLASVDRCGQGGDRLHHRGRGRDASS